VADRFDKFTERARKVFALAEDEARRFNHNYIGTEHLLLGILSEGEGVAAKVLVDLGTSLAKARSQVEFIIGRGDRTVRGDIGLTPRAKKVIELSVDEARRLNHHYIGTEHLLLGLVREGEGIAAGMLESLGISLSTVRVQVIHVLNQSSTYPTQQSRPEVDPPGRAEEWDRSRTPFGRLTVRARQVLLLASDTARKHGEPKVGVQHVLVGLVREGRGVSGRVLAELGITPEGSERTLEAFGGKGEPAEAASRDLTPRLKRVLTFAFAEMRVLGHTWLLPEHLLLGLIREDEHAGTVAWGAGDGQPGHVRARVLAGLAQRQKQVQDASQEATVASSRGSAAPAEEPRPGPIQDPTAPLPKLTDAEREVLERLTRSMNNREIATELRVSPSTVRRRVAGIVGKLGATDRAQAIAFAARMGLARERRGSEPSSTADSGEAARWVVRWYFEELLGKGRLEVADRIFDPAIVVLPHGGGREALERSVASLRATFSGLKVSIAEQTTEGDRVVTRWQARGIHQREFLGVAPTRKSVVLSGVHVHRVGGGRIVQAWEQIDAVGLLEQLGACTPGPPQP
jgi:DNA-binding CsgD family transcriptional regulator/predicted ester cyclase